MRNMFRKTTEDSAMAGSIFDTSPSPGENPFEAGGGARTNDGAPARNVDSGTAAESSPDAGAGGRVSVIGPSLAFKGMLSADEDLLIHGHIEGSISHHGAHLTIGAHAVIKADIAARRIIVQGTVQGDLRATESVVVEASAHVLGDISAPRVGIKDGATLKGAIDMDVPADAAAASAKPGNSGKASFSESGEKLGQSAVHEILDQPRS